MAITIKHLDGDVLATVDYDHRGLIGLEGTDLAGPTSVALSWPTSDSQSVAISIFTAITVAA